MIWGFRQVSSGLFGTRARAEVAGARAGKAAPAGRRAAAGSCLAAASNARKARAAAAAYYKPTQAAAHRRAASYYFNTHTPLHAARAGARMGSCRRRPKKRAPTAKTSHLPLPGTIPARRPPRPRARTVPLPAAPPQTGSFQHLTALGIHRASPHTAPLHTHHRTLWSNNPRRRRDHWTHPRAAARNPAPQWPTTC